MKEMFYLTTHSTHFIYGYMASDIIMVKNHSDRERGNPLPPHWLIFEREREREGVREKERDIYRGRQGEGEMKRGWATMKDMF